MPLRNASTTSPSSSIFSSFSAMTASRRGLHDVERLGSLLTLARLVLDLRSLGEGLEAVSTDAGVMHEEIFASVRRRDEAVALRVVEPLHGSCCHRKNTSLRLITNGKRGVGHRRLRALDNARSVATIAGRSGPSRRAAR